MVLFAHHRTRSRSSFVEEGQCEETPMKDLPTLVEEGNHRGARRGTKRDILSGAGAFSGSIAQRSEPRLHLGQHSWILLARGRPCRALQAGHKVIAASHIQHIDI